MTDVPFAETAIILLFKVKKSKSTPIIAFPPIVVDFYN